MIRKTEPTKYENQVRERINSIIEEYCSGSQQVLSDKTGVGKASISQYANGKNIPSNATATKIGKPFNINPAWIRGYDVPKSNKWGNIYESMHAMDAVDNLIKSAGWNCEPISDYMDDIVDDEKISIEYVKAYKISNTTFSFIMPVEDYGALQDTIRDTFKKKFSQIVNKHLSNIYDNSALNAAHSRTDIDLPEDIDTSEDDIMDDDNF